MSAQIKKPFLFAIALLSLDSYCSTKEDVSFHNLGGFVAGTIVQTPLGPETIQNIRVNDRVLSLDPSTGSVVESRVTEIFQEYVDEAVKVIVSGEELLLNPDHRFYNADTSEWTLARELKSGSHVLLSRSGSRVLVDQVEVTAGRTYVFDFTVEGTHNYFVGKSEILVHNYAFIIPIATWVIGEGLVLASAASVAIAAGIYAVDNWIESRRYSYAAAAYIVRNRLSPHSDAQGDHTTFNRGPDGSVNRYETYRQKGDNRHPNDPHPWESIKRFDRFGEEHFNKVTKEYVPTPHVHDSTATGGVRPPHSFEVPR